MPISFKPILLLVGALAVGPAWAEFKDPLDLPAEINTKLALSSRLLAVEQAGSRLIAVGPRGHILVSDDQGKNWRQGAVPVSSDLVAVQFVTPELGWAIGHDGVVLHSNDGGQSWTKQLDGFQAARITQKYVEELAASGDEEASARLEEVAILVEDGADKPFLDVLFLNEREGFIVGAYGMAFRTQDGGRTWTSLFGHLDKPGFHLYALTRVGDQVFVAGEQGTLLRWDQDSARFVELESPYYGSFFGLEGVGSSLVAYGLRGNAFISHDQGASWSELDTGGEDSVTGSAILGNNRYALVTQGGRLLLGTTGSTQLAEVPVDARMSFYDVAALGSDSVVVVGSRGVYVQPINIER